MEDTFKIKTRYYLKLLTPETMKLRGISKSKKKDKNIENVSNLEILNVVLVHCNIVNANYKRNSRILHRFVLNKLFGQLFSTSP